CQLRERTQLFNFRLHVVSRLDFKVIGWSRGSIGTLPPSPPKEPCATTSGTIFQLSDVDCTTAVNVWFAFIHRRPLPSGWTCEGDSCVLQADDFTGLSSSASFTWTE